MRGTSTKTVIAVFDLDRTITRSGTFNGFLRAHVAARPAQWWRLVPALATALRYAGGGIDRKSAKERLLRLFFGGTRRSDLEGEAALFAERVMTRDLRQGAAHAIEEHRRAGHVVLMATACMDFLAFPIARRLGISAVVATRLERGDGQVVSGDIEGDDCYGQSKLLRVAEALPKPREECFVVAYSDHRSDVPLLRWADVGVAVNPVTAFKREANDLGLRIADWDSAAGQEGTIEPASLHNQLEESFAQ
jgi:HAD superfamily hydrolase (TIGR01490 family)